MRSHLLALGLVLLGPTSLARADIPPGPGYVESCTVAIQQQGGDVCEECSTYYAEPTRCADTLGARGLTSRCRTPGASAWTEVWCRPRTEADGPAPAPAPAPPPPPAAAPAPAAAPDAQEGGSSCAVGGASSTAPLALVALAALAWLRRRR